MSFAENFGLSVTSLNFEAVQAYWKAVSISIAANADAELFFEKAILLDPELAIAYADVALLYQMWGNSEKSKKYMEVALSPIATISTREKRHIQIIHLILENEKHQAYLFLKNYIMEYPTDAFIVSQVTGAYGILAFSGKMHFEHERLQLLESIQKYYNDHWWFTSMYAYSLAEVFRLVESRKYAEKSLKDFYKNGHTAHSFVHVLYESGLHREANDFLDKWAVGYPSHAPIAGHIHWHHALVNIHLGNFEKALKVYDQYLAIENCQSPTYGKFIDAASFQWRLKLVSQEYFKKTDQKSILTFSSNYFNQIGDPFRDMHEIVALIANEQYETYHSVRDKILDYYNDPTIDVHLVMKTLLLAFDCYKSNEFDKAKRYFEIAMPAMSCLGGSHAQRDMIKETLQSFKL